ncbi:MAG: hypothetical protein AAFQ92_22295 [Bacteroidota bacterium]
MSLLLLLMAPINYLMSQEVEIVDIQLVADVVVIRYDIFGTARPVDLELHFWDQISEEWVTCTSLDGDIQEVDEGIARIIVWSWEKQFRNMNASISEQDFKLELHEHESHTHRLLLGYHTRINAEWEFVGLQIGYAGSWGVYANISLEVYDGFGSLMAGITKRIIPGYRSNLHLYGGLGLGEVFDELQVETGILLHINRMYFTLGLTSEPVDGIGIGLGIGRSL